MDYNPKKITEIVFLIQMNNNKNFLFGLVGCCDFTDFNTRSD